MSYKNKFTSSQVHISHFQTICHTIARRAAAQPEFDAPFQKMPYLRSSTQRPRSDVFVSPAHSSFGGRGCSSRKPRLGSSNAISAFLLAAPIQCWQQTTDLDAGAVLSPSLVRLIYDVKIREEWKLCETEEVSEFRRFASNTRADVARQ